MTDAIQTDPHIDTYEHIRHVQRFLGIVIRDLLDRQEQHDATKLESPEAEVYARVVPKLHGVPYGSEEYKRTVKELGPALIHHFEHNSHHPEHYPDLIAGMSLLDLIEMLCDWRAASMRSGGKNPRETMDGSQQRYHFSDDLKSIFLNTLRVIDAAENGGGEGLRDYHVPRIG